MANWSDIVNKRLEAGDKMVYGWAGKYDGNNGYIVLSKEKLLFVEEKGIIFKKAKVTLEVPDGDISKKEAESDNRFVLVKTDGEKHRIETRWLSRVVEALENLMKQEKTETESAIAA